MSTVAGLSSDRDKTRRKSCHRRNDSGELDVFNAKGYFSSTHDSLGHNISGTTLLHELGMMAIRDDCNSSANTSNRQGWREGRVSLDIPAMRYPDSHHYHHHHHVHYHRQHSVSQPQATSSVAKEKKYKQPSSPGGKLASFFNSLISQAVSKKKKSSKPSNSTEQESPSSWRWRRSSNNLSSSTTSTSTTSTRTRTSDNSGIRSSPPYPINTPTKSYKNLSSFSVSRSKNPTAKPNSATQVSSANLDWLDEKFKCIGVLSDQKQSNKGFAAESGGFKRFKEEDGVESDSSSDLFELQLNYECSSGLPVYETTCMDTIKRSSATPITNI